MGIPFLVPAQLDARNWNSSILVFLPLTGVVASNSMVVNLCSSVILITVFDYGGFLKRFVINKEWAKSI